MAHWGVSMLGFNLCFFPMHFLGLHGLPRRVCVYEPCFQWLNTLARFGALLSVFSGFMLVFILWESLAVGNRVIGIWGSKSLVLNVVTCPVPHHCLYISEPETWLYR